MTTRTRRRIGVLAGLVLLSSAPAGAAFHLMKIVEVFPGTPASPSAQYVVLQMYAPGQNLVSGHSITVFDAAGVAVPGGTFTFAANVANGANQAKILIATAQASAFFAVPANLAMNPVIPAAGGKICFDNLDCVAWGTYSGTAAGVGTPFNPGVGLRPSRAILRRLNVSGMPTILDSSDDTNNSATDFIFGTPAPRNNAGQTATIPPPNCGNGSFQGLEECDDSNLAGGDGCSATCVLEPPTEASVAGGMLVAPGTGTAVQVSFTPACDATDHAAYWGEGPIVGGVAWVDAACGLGMSGTAEFDPGVPPPKRLLYFVVVGTNPLTEGSFGRRSGGAQRPEALGVGACDLPRSLFGDCL